MPPVVDFTRENKMDEKTVVGRVGTSPIEINTHFIESMAMKFPPSNFNSNDHGPHIANTNAHSIPFKQKMTDGIITPATTAPSSACTSTSSSPFISPSPSPYNILPCFPPLSSSTSISSPETSDSSDTTSDTPEPWVAPASKKSLRTHNPIRAIIDPIMSNSIKSGKDRGDGNDQISLALGDPTAYGNIEPCPAIISAITRAIQSPSMAAGYINACGTPEARAAIAKHHSTLSQEFDNNSSSAHHDALDVSPDDVIIANGASGALELVLTALLDENSVLLVPRPGFPLYQVIAESHGARVVHYDLMPDSGWECDLEHMESLIMNEEKITGPIDGTNLSGGSSNNGDSSRIVRGILINNPSNPTGAVYSESHLMGIVRLAEKYKLPIISDEIYGDMTLNGELFHPMANVAKRMGGNVPVITASGLGKQYLVPGWRVGWIVFHDSNHGAIQEVKKGAQRLAQVILGASHLAQVAIPAVLDPPDETSRTSTAIWKNNLYATIQKQANILCSLLNECHGLEVIYPQGAMYAMVKIRVDEFDDTIVDDVSFMKQLLEEENIVVLPGRAFGMNGTATAAHADSSKSSSCYVFRVVFCAPDQVLREAAERISSFCLRHKNGLLG